MEVKQVRALLLGIVAGLTAGSSAWANPDGPTVVHGQVSMSRPNLNTLNITNSPGAVLNWRSFSIGANETTRFIQQSTSSSVLNRVIGENPSQILGQLLSNGRVFLVNPNGVVFGPNSVVDVAGLIASTLQMSDADFMAGLSLLSLRGRWVRVNRQPGIHPGGAGWRGGADSAVDREQRDYRG